MTNTVSRLYFLAFLLLALPVVSMSQSIDLENLKPIELNFYVAEGLDWKGESTQNTNWNKITETPDGKIWFAGGDHWGTDGNNHWDEEDRYERPWGFGNTTVHYYDPEIDKSFTAFELNRASALYSNAESPGHGKIHANIVSDSRGVLYTAGYMGASYTHEFTGQYFPKSYEGGAIIAYDPSTEDVDYLGIPASYGATVALYYDENRNIINGLSTDRQLFWRMNLDTMELNHYEAGYGSREMIMDNRGFCYFLNPFGGLTQFNPDTEEFTDFDIQLPGGNFRATVVSSDNTIYGISRDGFVWSFHPQTEQLEDLGHVLGLPDESVYTPNIALDEERQRLYFIAGNHGSAVDGHSAILTILDLNTNSYHWVGEVEEVQGSYGALVATDHVVYFSSYGYPYGENEDVAEDKDVRRPFLVRFDPPVDLASYEN
ncbi:MAG: hypothetical protein WD315_01850 [Balneolaceae bacterium]